MGCIRPSMTTDTATRAEGLNRMAATLQRHAKKRGRARRMSEHMQMRARRMAACSFTTRWPCRRHVELHAVRCRWRLGVACKQGVERERCRGWCVEEGKLFQVYATIRM